MEGRKRITTAFLLVLACCWLLILSNGGLAQTWQKVVPSGGSCSGSGSSAPTYLGVTSSTYTGSIGGYIGANSACVFTYGAGARMMKLADNRKINRSTYFTDPGRIDIRGSYSITASNTLIIDDYGYYNGSFESITCNTFNSNTGISLMLDQTGRIYTDSGTCSVAHRIHCVRD